MKRLACAFVLVASTAYAQQPPNCALGGFIVSPDETIWVCKGTGSAAVQLQTGGGSSVPVGAILLIDSGSCPAGYSEVAGLNGRTILGTLAANANAGSTGGSDTITPAGVNTGAAVADHASHTHTYTQVPNHVHVERAQGGTTASTTGTHLMTSTATGGSLRSSAASTLDPTGGVATGTTNGPSAVLTHSVTQPTFTGAQFDNRSAFSRVIFCRKT